MRCLSCANWCFSLFCKQCKKSISLSPSIRLVDEMSVYSFYAYSEIEFLMHYKYLPIGSRVFSFLAKKASLYFMQHFRGDFDFVLGVGIDDCIQRGFSHTGVILREFSQCGISPVYGELRAKNKISYAGKSLKFREENQKDFQSKLTNQTLILFDDIITTGTTLKEAKKLLQSRGNKILFAITLCNARK